MLTFTIGRSSISIMIDGDFNTVDKSAHNYEALRAELQKPEAERDLVAIRSLISVKRMIEAFSYGRVQITDDEQVLFDQKPVTNYLSERMLQIMSEGYDVTPFAKFMERVHANPAEYAKGELYEWLEAADLPIMSDGRFVAFKKVRKDYKDCHSGMFDNSVGAVLEMDRKSCDPNRGNECSTGFHFCSAGYLSSFNGERVMVLAIDPADVTAIPKDYNKTKGRTCRYEVIGELDSQSEAYKAAWKRGVVEFEDDTELPEVKFESRPKSVKLKPMQMPDARDKATIPKGKKAAAPNVVTKTEATKAPVVSTPKAPTPAKAAPVAAGDLTFPNPKGGVLTPDQIEDAVKSQGGNRPAARFLGVGESTIRGWLKKIKDRVVPTGPVSPLAATKTPTGLIFKTTDGREIAQSTVEDALKSEGSVRGAGRLLNVNESTIRSWRVKGDF